jgi:hypothetical protein
MWNSHESIFGVIIRYFSMKIFAADKEIGVSIYFDL